MGGRWAKTLEAHVLRDVRVDLSRFGHAVLFNLLNDAVEQSLGLLRVALSENGGGASEKDGELELHGRGVGESEDESEWRKRATLFELSRR